MGSTINLIDIWDSFKAAKVALGNTLEQDNIHTIATTHMQTLKVPTNSSFTENLISIIK